MSKPLLWKLGIVGFVVLLCAYFLYPSYRVYFGLSPEAFNALPRSEQDGLRSRALGLGLDLKGGMDLLLEVDTGMAGDNLNQNDVMERALGVLRNRVNEFGVAEPIIQQSGTDRIVVQLPGLTDPLAARRIVQRVAKLEFILVKEPQDLDRVFRAVDRQLALHLEGRGGAPDSVLADSLAADSLGTSSPLLSRVVPYGGGDPAFRSDDVALIQKWLEESGALERLPNARLLWGDVISLGGEPGQVLYVLDRKEQMTGEGIKRAVVRMSPDGGPEVDLQFSTRAAAQFARVTGNNVQRRLAIVLDGRVASAPVIQSRISGGRASISGGSMDIKEAAELKVVLEAGALPVPLKIIEERTVGPSLGRDSIRQGVRAAVVSGLLVIAFMIVYYRGSGLVSVIALALNTLILLAAMGRLSATLTLPGLAGIALTVGMAVDANVLIFERIREEIEAGKTTGAVIERGFSQALSAIIDSNVTTLIAALVLLQFGAGPIRGFAVTLAIGLVANLFTAVFVSRLIYDIALSRGLKKISV